ncbi:esterase-like activity of phytase family protein [Sphingomonas sp. KR1UV-12]|uniref:Esterase-like activity of phytase family protein n=1 Tax=Sphingomonas aurea TaxID=3063994 RepID=A0ABT9EMX3_9SPHN|nr:esterase-like activity of phytase family protein [Sphingomonas sp. KR1UV-12]MDP1027998.1 esterase-like activity of phytase family protein [Sphingomonas sp. KR1UV-12]
MRPSFLLATAAALLAPLPAAAVTLVSALAVPNGTDLSGLSGVGNNRFGGFGSDLIYDAGTQTFWSTTDRGPGGGVLSYAPRLQGFTLDINQNTGAIGGFTLTNTTLYTVAGQNYDGQNPQLLNGNSGTLGRSLDPEGLARLPNGNLLVSDEYGPSVYEFTKGGQFVRAFETPSNLLPRDASGNVNYVDGYPTSASGRQDNRGFEGLTISPDGKTAYAILQDPLQQDGKPAKSSDAPGIYSRNTRIVAFDVATGKQTAQYVYQLESLTDINDRIPGTSDDFKSDKQGRSIGVSAIQAVGDKTLLVLERDNRGFGVDDPNGAKPVGSKQIFKIDLTNATDVKNISVAGSNGLPAGVTPVAKSATPFLDIAAALRAMGQPVPEKIEGFAFGPRLADGSYTLIVVTDNDYSVTQNGSGTQFDVCTSGVNGSGTSVQVALGAGCPAGTTLLPNMVYSFRLSEAEYASLTAAVPEPATWALMLTGFAMVGAAARRRRKVGVRFA